MSQPDAAQSSERDAEHAVVAAALDDLLENHPPTMLDNREFRGQRYDAGLAWVQFPKGFGGLGVRPELNTYVEEHVQAAGAQAPEPSTFFMALAGPTLCTHGTDEQRQRFLRPMFTGEHTWCQLFSEPGAGSDFAGLATRAIRDGDVWLVNGQKVWNTLAHVGDWGMLVTRTNVDAPKHKGMTYFAIDMRSPGVDVRPLRQITGEAEFNEVYLTDVRIPDDDRIGAVGEGWRVALTTLMNERTTIGGGGGDRDPAAPLLELWRSLPADERTAPRRDQLVRLWSAGQANRLTNARSRANARRGNPGPEGSISKLAFAEFNKAMTAFCVDLLGADGQIGYDYTFRRPSKLSVDGMESGLRHAFLRTRANSIEGGTSEIMRNILGEQVLGLPGEPRVDKETPWALVPRS